MKYDAFINLLKRQDAKDWLAVWGLYSRACDNIIDDGLRDRKSLTESWALANRAYSHPFYRQNAHLLQSACLVATTLWAVANEWERGDEPWERQWADVLRHSDVAILIAVCLACGTSWLDTQEAARITLLAAREDHLKRHGEPKE